MAGHPGTKFKVKSWPLVLQNMILFRKTLAASMISKGHDCKSY